MKITSYLPVFLIFCSSFSIEALAQTPPAGDATAQLEVRLDAMEDEIRTLRGRVEEDDFQIKKLSDSLEKYQKDTDFRFNGMANNKAAAADATVINAAQGEADTGTAPLSERRAIPGNPASSESSATVKPLNGGAGEAPAVQTSFATAREHYNYAFRLLNQTQYDEAAKAFDAFTKKYPKDPLIGNAYYWEGETYYIRRDYVHSADDFRQGFESMPDGPKAADNLFKLAMSLDALSRDKEACVVLKQITVKFNKTTTNVLDKANQEQKRIGCQ